MTCKFAFSPSSESGQRSGSNWSESPDCEKEPNFMLLSVVIAKSLIELSLMFIMGRFVLGWLAGARSQSNVFWQMLDIAARPALWLTRRLSPKLILDRHMALAAASWLSVAWVFVFKLKIDLCLALGASACR